MDDLRQGPVDLLVRRDDLRDVKLVSAPDPDEIALDPGGVLLRIEKFGFTANNITYATFGDAMRYWDFFPGPDGYGRVPVWGYAEVIRSSHDDIAVGERVFGYLPMSAYLVVHADKVTPAGFVDGSPHRAELPAVYQRLVRLAGDPTHQPDLEDLQAIWRPLYMTSFGAADFLADNGLYGAEAVVFSSASSKTALGTAFLLARDRPSGCRVVGLTSQGNAEFCRTVGYYDDVVTYDNVETLPSGTRVVYVDLAGNPSLIERLRAHLGDDLKKVVLIGATQWEQVPSGGGLAGDAEFFFLPPWMEKRREEWGPREFGARYSDAWQAFLPSVKGWMGIVHAEGPTATEGAYRAVLEGKSAPDEGLILSLNAWR
ncbi:MAG: DUF2855 family protein [Actinomycetota bacterium]